MERRASSWWCGGCGYWVPDASRRLLALALVLTASCSVSSLAIQSRTADTLGRTVNAAGGELLAEYRREQNAALDRYCPSTAQCDGVAARGAVDAVRASWRPVVVAHDALRSLHDRWATAIERCARTNGDRTACTPDVGRVVEQVLGGVRDLRCALRAGGHAELDPIPGDPGCAGIPAQDGGAQ